ncbi:hypothetical protein OAL15_02555 [Flavobacteriales bacterium]|nr:hypothetical protein [Flavobacteriales bacterium]
MCSSLLSVNGQHFDWAQSIGGPGLDVGRAVTTDADGNVIVVGSFTGSTHIADTFLTGYGSMESFVAKFTSEGELLWANVISGPAEDMARGVVTDSEGNIFVVGHFTDTVVFSITETQIIAAKSEGKQDVFVVRYSADGEILWALTGGGTEDDTATDIDGYKWSGKLYVSGGFQKRANFGTATVLSNGLTDAFLMKIDSDGNVHWVEKGGGLEHDIAASVAVDQTNESIYIVGDFYGEADLSGTELQALGSSDVFIAKYNDDGQMQWAETNGGTTVDVATSVGTDLNGFAYVSGYYQGTTFFQNHTATAISYNDVFVSQFDANGNCNWLSSAGSWGLDNCLGMAVDWDGSTYLTGMFEEEMITPTDSASGNGYDIFILVYEPNGEVRYVRSVGAASSDFGMAACLGTDQSLYITGYYFHFAEFDDITIGAADYGDCFVARMADILDIESDSNSEVWSHCFSISTELNQVDINCNLKGEWFLYNTVGQILDRGNINKVIEIPPGLHAVSILSLKTTRGTYSMKIASLSE